MVDGEFQAGAQPAEGLVTLAHVMYGLHAFSAISGLLSPAFIVTAFLTGWPSLIAVVLNYLKRSRTRGTWVESHFRWQIRTFWFAVLWFVLAYVLALTFVALPLAIVLAVMTGAWVLYRIGRGWWRLVDGRGMPL
jgi:uncharacterized membrane protein